MPPISGRDQDRGRPARSSTSRSSGGLVTLKLLAATVAMALVLVSPAFAKVAAPAAGSFTVSDVAVTTVRTASDATCLVGLSATFSFTGTLQGWFRAPFAIVHHGACDQPAAEHFVAHGTFSGSVALGGSTRTGAFDFVFSGTIDAASNARGTLRILRGAVGLQGLGGAVTLTGVSGVGGTYQGTLRTHTTGGGSR